MPIFKVSVEDTVAINDSAESRVKKFGEVFTPPKLVNEILDKFPKTVWKAKNKTWIDPTCGDGAFLIEIKRRLLAKGHSLEHILENMLYGVDIQQDNVQKCIATLYEVDIKEVKEVSLKKLARDYKGWKGTEGIICLFRIGDKLIKHFVCADGLLYQYNFGEESDVQEKDKGKTTIQERLF